jgi:diacylglycerol O-acyltransferase / wax synthase
MHFPRDLEPFDYLMFRGESDPRSRTAALTIALLDVAPDFARLRTAFDRASRVVIRLRQHVVVPALPIAPAQWITDPDFDLDFHVRRIRIAEPGTMRQLLDFGATFHARPFDTARPLWEALLVEGLEDADAPAALIIKMHHAVTDGVGAIELFKQLYDFDRDAERGPLPPVPSPEDVSSNDLAQRAVQRMPLTMAQNVTRRVARAVRMTRQLLEQPGTALQDATKLLASAQRVLGPSPVPSSPLLRRRSLGRRFEWLEVPLADFRAAGKAAGGSLNDAFIAALSGALRLYHEGLGVPVEGVPLAMPVSLRSHDDPAGGNRFAGARITAPVGELDPAKRIALIRQQVLSAVAEPAINILSVIAPIASRLPASLLATLASGAGGIDIQASNVPGYVDPPYIAGAKITKVLPFGPLPGVPMMVVLVTMAGTCYVGAHYDTASVTDDELFATCLRAGFDEVLALKPTPATTEAGMS